MKRFKIILQNYKQTIEDGLEDVSKDKKKQGKLSTKDKVAFEKYMQQKTFIKI